MYERFKKAREAIDQELRIAGTQHTERQSVSLAAADFAAPGVVPKNVAVLGISGLIQSVCMGTQP